MDGMCVQQVERNHLLSLPRLLNNRMLELRQQFLMRPKKSRDQVTNLRQNLFGCSPSDRKENIIFACQELKKMTQADSQRWNFDIDAGTPTEGQYHWELLNETNQALDTSGRLTCLTTKLAASPALNKSSNGYATSSITPFMSSSPSSSTSSTSSSSASLSPNGLRAAATNTTFSTSTTPTPVISKKCVKRLQKSVSNKVPKLITDYFKESKPVAVKYKDIVTEEKEVVSNRIVEILKIKSMNVR